RESWTYLGEVARKPMFPPDEWDKLVIDHAPPNALFVAIDDSGDVVGFSAVHPKDCEMFLLFVHPAFVGRGVGRVSLQTAHEMLRAAGCPSGVLFTPDKNKRELPVYEAAGYRREGFVRESDFRGIHLREPRLVKQL